MGIRAQEGLWPPRGCVENDQSVVMGFHLILLNPTCPETASPMRVGMRWGVGLLRTLALRRSGMDWTYVEGLESEGGARGR